MSLALSQFDFSEVGGQILGFLPNLAIAVALILLGWLVARLIRSLSIRLLRTWSTRVVGGIGRLFRSRDVEARIRRADMERPVAIAVANIVFWVVFFFFMAAAAEALGLPVVSTWLSGFALYLPRALAAVLIVLLGIVTSNLIASAIVSAAEAAGLEFGRALARSAQVVVIMVALVVGFDQLGLEVTFLIVILATVTASALGAAALAFGLGARTSVSNIIASHYLSKTYKLGDVVQLGESKGKIVEITPTGVVISSEGQKHHIPAKKFSEQASTLLGDEH